LQPEQPDGLHYSNSDPVTGQAAWYDLKVRIEKVAAHEARATSPQLPPLQPPPGLPHAAGRVEASEDTAQPPAAGVRR
jgi:sulfite dehydrogenase (quinone) subunit SoeA